MFSLFGKPSPQIATAGDIGLDPEGRILYPSPSATEPKRSYAAAQVSRLTGSWTPANSSADSELVSSLTTMRARARSLVRDASYAKRAKVLVVNNVVGTGIGMQAQVKTNAGKLNARVNEDIERAFEEWCSADSCHTGGRLSFKNLERALMAQVFEAGEVFVRKHYRPFGRSRVPFALELIEAERLADEFMSAYLGPANGNEVRMGVEVDRFHRPIAYFIRERHPSEFRFGNSGSHLVERVPADQIIHLAVVDRWPQTRGEPWLHTAIKVLNHANGYTEAEIVRARSQAHMPGAIETPQDTASFGEPQPDGSAEMQLEPGVYKRLNPGEKLHQPPPTAPNSQLEPFMRYLLREIAAGTGPSYSSLSRDYSQGTYSSERIAALDDRDLWRFFQAWFIGDFRQLVHIEWLRQSVLSRAIESIPVEQYALDSRKFEAVRFKPRGWSWVDPTKEVAAYKEAVICGFTTVTDVIAATAGGADIEDVLEQRESELKLMEEKGLVFETSPDFYDKPEPAPKDPAPPPPDDDDAGDESATNAPPNAGRVVLGVVR